MQYQRLSGSLRVWRKIRRLYWTHQVTGALKDVRLGMTTKKGCGNQQNGTHCALSCSISWKLGMVASRSTRTENNLDNKWGTFVNRVACSDHQMSRREIPVSKVNLLDSVQCMMKSDDRVSPFPHGRPGKVWFDAFLRRNPLVAERNAECRGRGALTKGCIRKWYSDAQKFFVENKMWIHDTGWCH